ncbi:MAG: acetyl-CoA carboxylase biotin carboxyl carrier protein [Arsenophonus endosymbiont of Ceratovacuna japonica]
MDIRKIKKLIKIVEKSDISELEILESGETTVRISRAIMQNSSNVQQQISSSTTNQSILKNNINPSIISHKMSNEKKIEISGYKIRSPMVGIFYRGPSIDAKPFIEVGQIINIGDPICIIEAMKMMNKIESDKEGIVKAILLKNGEAVEFDEPLVII